MSVAEKQKRVLIADDDPRLRKIMKEFLEKEGYEIIDVPDAEEALDAIEKKAVPDLVLMDVRMPGMGGMEGLAKIHQKAPLLPVMLITAYAEIRDAVEAMRCGAVDYLEKPVDLVELRTIVEEVLGVSRKDSGDGELPPLPDDFVVHSEAMKKIVIEADKVAPTDATVLITGESGTGKEKIAEFVHGRSRRRDAPFIRFNCSAIPESLMESELFGYSRGAFTGAETDRAGKFEAAQGGTVLLDEVGDLPFQLQPKLLRVLEDGSYQRIGDAADRKADVRVIAATNHDLEADVEEGRFREDLFWRLNVFTLRLPPLRERSEEITTLARLFLSRYGKKRSRISEAALNLLSSCSWPGNVRELRNVLERASILAPESLIMPHHFPETIRRKTPEQPTVGVGEGKGRPIVNIEEAERTAIGEALRRTAGNRTEAAKLLGISRRTLFYRLKKYGCER